MARMSQLAFRLTVVAVMTLVTLAEAEEQLDPEVNAPSPFSDSFPQDPHFLEEQVVEETSPSSMYEGIPHPRPYEQEELRPKEKTETQYPKKFRNDTEDSIPEPHLLEDDLRTESPLLDEEGNMTIVEENDHLARNDSSEDSLQSSGEGSPKTAFPQDNDKVFLHTLTEEDPLHHDREQELHPHQHVTYTSSTEPSSVDTGVVQEPVVMPVTEGRNRTKFDPVAAYGIPKELMPIHPGGGSRFEDLEKEKLEQAKMAQTKVDDDKLEEGSSYDAEGLYSSASALQLTSAFVFMLLSLRIAN